jgi:hypothetical protein
VSGEVSPKPANAVVRNRRRALFSFVLSLVILPAWVYLWLRGNVSGWWVVLWVLASGQLAVVTLFTYRWRSELRLGRWWFQQIAITFAWAIAVGLVVAQLSVFWMVSWYVFASVWIGTMSLAYVRGRKNRA